MRRRDAEGPSSVNVHDSPPVYFVHISDTHIGSTREDVIYERNTYACTGELLAAIGNLPVRPDFIMHTGDIVNNPTREAYKLAAELFASVTIPTYFVTGNHDEAGMITSHLSLGPVARGSRNSGSLYYSFTCKGHILVVLDARGPDESDPSGLFPEGQIAFLREELARDPAPVSVFVHFPPLPLDSQWIDAKMLLINGRELHEALVPVRDRVRGVFYGHVHRGIQQMKDGILYSSVASAFRQFSAFPPDVRPEFDQGLPAFNLVALFADRTIIKEHSVGH